MKQTISILVENRAGVLNRVASLFSRRAFNIDSLAVGVTDDPSLSRMTIIVDNGNSVVEQVEKQLTDAGFRCEVDERAEKIGYKIREAQLKQIPYMLIVGEKEMENQMVSVRKRDEGDLGGKSMEEFLEVLGEEE